VSRTTTDSHAVPSLNQKRKIGRGVQTDAPEIVARSTQDHRALASFEDGDENRTNRGKDLGPTPGVVVNPRKSPGPVKSVSDQKIKRTKATPDEL
jgi:hypothetical protein